jgi:hypothetical protein
MRINRWEDFGLIAGRLRNNDLCFAFGATRLSTRHFFASAKFLSALATERN